MSFSIVKTASGAAIPAGTYYVALWVDDQRQVDESNEANNASLGQNRWTCGGVGKIIVSEGPDEQQEFNGLPLSSLDMSRSLNSSP